MSEPIKRSQIAEEGVLDNLLKPLRELISVTEQTDKQLQSTAESIKKSFNFAETAKGLSDLDAQYKKTIELQKEKKQVTEDQSKAQKALASAQEKLQSLSTQEAKDLLKTREAIRSKTNEIKASGNAYKELSNKSRDLKNQSKQLGAELLKLELSGKKNTKGYRELSAEYQKVSTQARVTDSQLKKLDKTVGDNFRNVGNYTNSTQKLTSALGKLGIAVGIGAIFKNVTGVIKDFNQAQVDLQAISGKSAEELSDLTKQARELGGSTQFSATEITGLQIELAKLGFTTQQITASTGGIANFAAATGVEIPRAAALAGSTLRAFGLDASEMDRVVSVLGVATTKTALDFSKLENGLSTIAPVAKAFGFSVEDTTALLGQLANSGFDASSAATATRNILLNLADANGDLAKELGRPIKSADDLAAGLKELQERGIDLGAALELTDKRSVAAFQTFLDGSSSLVGLRDSITDVNGELKDMADKRIKSVDGAMKLLNSSWEEYILSMDDAIGASDAFQKTISFIAENLGTIISVLGKLIIGFLSYKIALIAINVQQKIANKGVLNLAKGFFTLGKNAKTAGAESSKMGKTLKGIGWAALIGVAIELAVAFYDIASGARDTRRALNALNAGKEESNKITSEFIKKEKESHDERMRLLDEEIRKRKAQGEDENKLNEERLKREEEIKNASLEKLQVTANTQAEEFNKLNQLFDLIKKNDIAVILRQNQNSLTAIQKQRLSEYTSLIGEVNKFSNILKGQSIGEIARSKDVQNEILKEKTLRGESAKTFLNEIKTFKNELSELKVQEIELASARENNRDKINAEQKSLKKLNKEREREILNLKEINDLLKEGKTLEQIEDDEISDLNNAIERSLNQRITIINDAERERAITEKEAQEQRVLAEIDALTEKRKILLLYGRDVVDIDREISEKRLELSKFFNNEEKKINIDSRDRTLDLIREVGNAYMDLYSNIQQRQLAAAQQQQELIAQQITGLQQMAATGSLTAKESLTELMAQQDEYILKQEEIARKERALAAFKQFSAIFMKELENTDNPASALAKTSALMTTLQASLPTFYDGTENTGKGGALDSKGGFLAKLHPNERVVDAKNNAPLLKAGITNPMLPELALKGLHADRAGNSYDLIRLEKKLDSVVHAIENQPSFIPELQKTLAGTIKLVTTERSKGLTKINKHRYD